MPEFFQPQKGTKSAKMGGGVYLQEHEEWVVLYLAAKRKRRKKWSRVKRLRRTRWRMGSL